MFDLLEELHRERGMTTVLVTHNPDLAKRCDKIFHDVPGRNSPRAGFCASEDTTDSPMASPCPERLAMFEKYNEKARRALFFARYEASKLGSKVIESEHLLLGILREGEDIIKEIFSRFNVKPEEVRREIEGDRIFVERISSTAELPLSEESKKILAYASHEAESMMHPYVGTEHLLIGLLRVDGCVAGRLLTARGFNLYGVREETISLIKEREVSKQKKELPFLAEYSRDLTQLARRRARSTR